MKKLFFLAMMALSCTKKTQSSNETSDPSRTQTCALLKTAAACTAASECYAHTGYDTSSKEPILLSCMPYAESVLCTHSATCYEGSDKQRAVAETKCSSEGWTETICSSAEKTILTENPCDVPTAAACDTQKKCRLRYGRDVVSKENVAIGCIGEFQGCGAAITCYSDSQASRRIVSPYTCQTFAEWKTTDCQAGDEKSLEGN